MTTTAKLRPTLWRTCRVLANRNRLRIYACLLQHPDQTVTAVSSRLHLPMAVTSQYLRALEARSLLVARRRGRFVLYRISEGKQAGAVERLVPALQVAFERESNPIEAVFKLATAFTHPRRVEIVRALAGGALTLAQLHDRTGISYPALMRHLAKLEARGFLMRGHRAYGLVLQRAPVARALVMLACE